MSYSNGTYPIEMVEHGILETVREEGIVAGVEKFREESEANSELSRNGFVPTFLDSLVKASVGTMRPEWEKDPLAAIDEIYGTAKEFQRPPRNPLLDDM